MQNRVEFTPRPFRPAWWLPGTHAQTIAGRYVRPPHGVHYRRERLETADGDFLDLDHATVDGHAVAADAPVCLVVHGLEGSSGSSYVLETARVLAARGIRAVAMNFRSCSGEMNRTARFYNAGETGDLGMVVDHVGARYPGARRLAIGFSLGGNMLLKYLGERGAGSPVRAAVAVSVPFDLAAGSDKLDRSPMGRFYGWHFTRRLQAKVRAKRHLMPDDLPEARVLAARTLRGFDEAATARLYGFRDAGHYYAASSSAAYLHAIRVPTLLVQALDDPFVDADAIPRGTIDANPCLAAAFTARGGHVGFIGGSPRRPEFWAEREAARFLAMHAGTERAEGAGGGVDP